MASYWAAYYGTALVLNENEFENFKEKYSGIHKINLDEIFEDMPIQEYEFVRSKNINLSNGIVQFAQENLKKKGVKAYKNDSMRNANTISNYRNFSRKGKRKYS